MNRSRLDGSGSSLIVEEKRYVTAADRPEHRQTDRRHHLSKSSMRKTMLCTEQRPLTVGVERGGRRREGLSPRSQLRAHGQNGHGSGC